MKQYKANGYFKPSEGIYIFSPTDANIQINIKAGSSNEIIELTNKILAALNADYNMKQALLKDNQENYDMGIITTKEKEERDENILSQSF